MAVVLVFEVNVLRMIFGCAPQSGRSLEEKQSFMMHYKMNRVCMVWVI